MVGVYNRKQVFLLCSLSKVLSLNIVKFSNFAKLEMPVKVRPQNKIALATSKLPAPTSLISGWDCHVSTCPSRQVPLLTTNNVPLTEVFTQPLDHNSRIACAT